MASDTGSIAVPARWVHGAGWLCLALMLAFGSMGVRVTPLPAEAAGAIAPGPVGQASSAAR